MNEQAQVLKINNGTMTLERKSKVDVKGINSIVRTKNVGLPKISLIIPVLQEEKIFINTLNHYPENLLKKYNVELIVSDGGSTDNTVEIAKAFTELITIHNMPERQTISEGRNKGADIATGDVFVFMNGDTFPENPEEFFSYISEWAKGKSVLSDCFALTCWVTIPPEELLLKDKIFYAIHNRYIKFLNSIGFGMGRGECQIVTREYFQIIGGYDKNLAAGEDFDLFQRLAKITKIGFIKGLKVYESPRRFRKFGYFRIIMSWLYNSISVMFYGKSISKEWEPVR